MDSDKPSYMFPYEGPSLVLEECRHTAALQEGENLQEVMKRRIEAFGQQYSKYRLQKRVDASTRNANSTPFDKETSRPYVEHNIYASNDKEAYPELYRTSGAQTARITCVQPIEVNRRNQGLQSEVFLNQIDGARASESKPGFEKKLEKTQPKMLNATHVEEKKNKVMAKNQSAESGDAGWVIVDDDDDWECL